MKTHALVSDKASFGRTRDEREEKRGTTRCSSEAISSYLPSRTRIYGYGDNVIVQTGADG